MKSKRISFLDKTLIELTLSRYWITLWLMTLQNFWKTTIFYKNSTVHDIIIPDGGVTLILILNEKLNDLYEKNLFKLTFSITEKISQINSGIKPDKISNLIDSIHSKSPQVNKAHTVELIFADSRRIEITFHFLDCSPYSDEQDIIISK